MEAGTKTTTIARWDVPPAARAPRPACQYIWAQSVTREGVERLPRVRSVAKDASTARLLETGSGLGDRLRRERQHTGITLRELARRLEVSPSMISQIETGKIRPSVRMLYALLGEYGLTAEQLFASETDTEPDVDGSAVSEADSATVTGADWVSLPRRRTTARERVQRADTRRAIELESGVRWERLTATSEDEVDFHETIYDVGGASSPAGQLVRHHGREFGLVINGSLGITIGHE